MGGEIKACAGTSSRREFVQAGVGLSAAVLAAIAAGDRVFAADADAAAKPGKSLIRPGDVILFQGDSITDAGRNRDVLKPNLPEGFGNGYAWLAAAQLLIANLDAKLQIFDRGISGNKVPQLAERWQADCLDIKPNVLSILIGVNDFYHNRNSPIKELVEVYERGYRELVQRTQAELKGVKLVICEPFLLEAGGVEAEMVAKFDGFCTAAKRVADEAGAVFVPFQSMFQAAAKIAPAASWAADGVHPTSNGASLMASWWLRAVRA